MTMDSYFLYVATGVAHPYCDTLQLTSLTEKKPIQISLFASKYYLANRSGKFTK
jgi:hypothetical protein